MLPSSLYSRLKESELTPVDALDRIFEKARIDFYQKRRVDAPDAPSHPQDSSLASTDFELNLGEPGSEGAVPQLDDFETFFLAELEREGAINAWQAEQLRRGRVRFCLGDYRVVDLLGRGGYGNVFLGRRRSHASNSDASGGRHLTDVALKVLPLAAATPDATRKFLREIEIARRLKHENVVRFLGASKDAAVHYAVYEYADAGDARRLLARYERLPARVAAYVASETAKALAYLHELGVVHRDVKPGNILLTKTGDVKLGDFGFISPIEPFSPTARLSPLGAILEGWDGDDENERRDRSKIKGTPDYMAPDQILNPDAPSPRWDVYSLGSALYFMLTGVVPFPSVDSDDKLRAHLRSAPPPEPSAIAPNVPIEISRLTMRMLERDPERRVASAQEVVDSLKRWAPTRSELRRVDFLSSVYRRDDDDDFWSETNLQIAFSRPPSPGDEESSATSKRPADRKKRFTFFGGSDRSSRSSKDSGSRSESSGSTRVRVPSEPQNFDQAFELARREERRAEFEAQPAAPANFEEAFGFVEQAFESARDVSPPSAPSTSTPVAPSSRSTISAADSTALDEQTRRLERLNAILIRRVLVPLLVLTSLALAAALVDAFF